MNIYFAGSIRGGREDRKLYQELIAHLQTFGTVLTEHIGEAALGSMGETGLSDTEIYERDMSWLESADVVVAEVTQVSLGVGYELGIAHMLKKPTLCLFRPSNEKRLSAMIHGNTWFHTTYYTSLKEGLDAITTFFTRDTTQY